MDNTHRFLQNALEILEEVALGKEKVSIQALAERRQLSYASCYRIIRTYTELGWLERDEHGIYRSTPGLLIKLDRKHEQDFIVSIVGDALHTLVDRTGLAAKLTMRQGDEAVSFFTLQSPRPNGISTNQGSRFHLAAGSSGACYLSGMTDREIERILRHAPEHYWRKQKQKDVHNRIASVRETGVAFDLGTFSDYFNAISTPLFGPNNMIVAAVTVLGFPSDFEPHKREPLRREILRVASAYDSAVKPSSENIRLAV